MSFDFDVSIIGGGPIGSTIAYYLSKRGLSVCIIEKKKEIGYPLQCAGILSKKIFDLNELPDEVIINKVKGAFIHSQNHILNVEKDADEAYVIDRIGYDKFLFNRAVQNGASLINQKAVDFDIENAIVHLSDNQKIKSKVIVGCDGHNSILSKQMGNAVDSFNATQFLVEISDESIMSFRNSDKLISNYVDTCILEEILPGFLWVIPTNEDSYRIGLFSKDSHKSQELILQDYLNEHFEFEIKEKFKGFIPIFNDKNRLVKDKAILIGDAASQVKPTSGGGLLIGFDACKMACECILEAIEKDFPEILKEYERNFFKKYSKEFNYQIKVQKSFNLFTKEDFDYLFIKLKDNDCERIISEFGDMDEQSILVKEFIKRGLIFKIVPTFLFKKVGKIFGF
ncbi:hypothetical protein TL18_03235 [Methanobrevibacter sp. YE315]|uniref:geranylgeranyl reductase family protein n=1 Tax=Methanobrevibacter sp. YE315 TaxID=1609968 RepID=UPI000764E36A|nr:NAD(P)/FAD-dependent oxidoreductase [Methanobrevibacter sp. YE315]AMD17123.1 hypothetical protein TL18_03235 [Methanobrevibacter sp. YE315]